jgi:hypothetical protein
MRARGFVAVTEWIPADAKPIIRDLCKRLRDEATTKEGNETRET